MLNVTSDTIVVKADATDPGAYTGGATISGISCPSPGGDSFAVTFGVIAIPYARAYLYLYKNALFNDSTSVSVDSNGMLSSSESSSVQQITAILQELAQTAELFVAPGGRALTPVVQPGSYARQKCFKAIANLVKSGPYYDNHPFSTHWRKRLEESDSDVALDFRLQSFAGSTGQESLEWTRLINIDGTDKSIGWRNGLLAFFPVPAKATVSCIVTLPDHTTAPPVYLNAPTMVNLYIESQFVDPQRDFLTNPTDAFTFNAGFITGHKYTGQSSAKTIVDTVTAPIRAMLPSPTVQQTTSVVTGGGKPEQTTTTTQTTTGPPKSP